MLIPITIGYISMHAGDAIIQEDFGQRDSITWHNVAPEITHNHRLEDELLLGEVPISKPKPNRNYGQE